jgi:hypothetical protein
MILLRSLFIAGAEGRNCQIGNNNSKLLNYM